MWTLETSKTKSLTKALAQHFMTMEPAPHDRELSQRRLSVYRQAIAAGEWRPCRWAAALCEETGITYRVNGKHTSTVFAEMDAIPPDLYVNVETYVCPTLADVARLYGTFDASIQSRTARDITRAFAATMPELAVVPMRTLNACAAGIQLYDCGGIPAAASRVRPTVRAERVLDECVFVLWVNQIVADSHKYAYLDRAGVIAAMFATYKKSQKDALRFWTAVRSETGASPHDPDRMLARWLIVTSAKAQSAASTPRSRIADPREFYVKSLHCWNAWRRQEQIKAIKYYTDAKIPAAA